MKKERGIEIQNKKVTNAAETPDPRRNVLSKSRRGFLGRSLGLLAGGAVQLIPSHGEAQQTALNSGMLERLTSANGRPILLKDGLVLSMDPQIGDFEKGDVLIQGKKIISVGTNTAAPANAIVVDA